ncbi:4-oxalomesaconate tautomerase [uncultured Cohaesibacter sp.]|uniref:4-oxalomesaconate tautomerase n=1 Tax=uncultured Cohaesibacter sp. TaxID=1002546 RepID=UPI00292EF8F4|nr:4-oxalomesaconate tautomerase [uncultured Cohaesibacter sp.]
MSSGTRCMWMRGGTSKGGFFLAEDLPQEIEARDAMLLRVMGSPDLRQIDGMGGADPLTSKVAVIRPSRREGIDVDYLFLQVFVDRPVVSDSQNCGNMLAGVGPFAIERGLVEARDGETSVSVYMQNTGQVAELRVQTPNRTVTYEGEAQIDGVPGTAAAIPLTFKDTEGATCGALLPTGNAVDQIDGVKVTMIDNGMPVVIIAASEMGITGYEDRAELDANDALKTRLESIRLQAGKLMNLGDVSDKSVPKMSLVASAVNGGCICTRTFIPHRCHASIGVLGAVSVATACALEEGPARELANLPEGDCKILKIEHPSGDTATVLDFDDQGLVVKSALLRTARKLFDGTVYS